MTIFNSLVLYFIIWWLSIFLFLPIEISKQRKLKKGNDPGAPEDPKLKKKFIYTTLFALLVWTIIFITIKISNYEV